MESKKTIPIIRIGKYIFDAIFYIIAIMIIFTSVMVIYKSLMYPDKIPDIFTYKPFIILDNGMEETIEYGDLAITQITDAKKIKNGDIIAFKNKDNFVIIKKIIDIKETENGKSFMIERAQNETENNKYVSDKDIEGVLVKKLSGMGTVFTYMQDPMFLLVIIIIILIIGAISYYIADKLDKKMEKVD